MLPLELKKTDFMSNYNRSLITIYANYELIKSEILQQS